MWIASYVLRCRRFLSHIVSPVYSYMSSSLLQISVWSLKKCKLTNFLWKNWNKQVKSDWSYSIFLYSLEACSLLNSWDLFCLFVGRYHNNCRLEATTKTIKELSSVICMLIVCMWWPYRNVKINTFHLKNG